MHKSVLEFLTYLLTSLVFQGASPLLRASSHSRGARSGRRPKDATYPPMSEQKNDDCNDRECDEQQFNCFPQHLADRFKGSHNLGGGHSGFRGEGSGTGGWCSGFGV